MYSGERGTRRVHGAALRPVPARALSDRRSALSRTARRTAAARPTVAAWVRCCRCDVPTTSPCARHGHDRPEPLWRELVGASCGRERLARGERLADVAERAGVSTQYLSEVERGLKDPSSEMLSAVAGALGPDRPASSRSAPPVPPRRTAPSASPPDAGRPEPASAAQRPAGTCSAAGRRRRRRSRRRPGRGAPGRGRCPRGPARRSGRCAGPGSPRAAARTRATSSASRIRSGMVPAPLTSPAGAARPGRAAGSARRPGAPAGQQHRRRPTRPGRRRSSRPASWTNCIVS